MLNDQQDFKTLIKQFIQDFSPDFSADDSTILTISSKFRSVKIDKGEFFLKKGEHSSQIGIMVGGLMKAYFTNEKGDTQVSRFYCLNDNPIAVSLESFLAETKAVESIQAVKDTFLLTISRDDLYQLYKMYPAINTLGRIMAEQSYCKALRRIHMLQSLSAEERFSQFYSQSKDLINKLDRKDIASYLGMHRNRLHNLLSEKGNKSDLKKARK